jgi:hypothetical protein
MLGRLFDKIARFFGVIVKTAQATLKGQLKAAHWQKSFHLWLSEKWGKAGCCSPPIAAYILEICCCLKGTPFDKVERLLSGAGTAPGWIRDTQSGSKPESRLTLTLQLQGG